MSVRPRICVFFSSFLKCGIFIGLCLWLGSSFSFALQLKGELPTEKQIVEQGGNITVHLYTQSNAAASFFGQWLFSRQSHLISKDSQAALLGSLGSGIFISRGGYIITNAHLIQGVSEIYALVGQKSYPASLIGTDPFFDLALLSIPLQNNPFAFPAPLKETHEGLDVIALGQPTQKGIEVDKGSVKKAFVPVDQGHRWRFFTRTNLTHANVLDGGPVLNREGHLLGMTQNIYTSDGEPSDQHVMVPSEILYAALHSFQAGHTMLNYPWLGLEVKPMFLDGAPQDGESLGVIDNPAPTAPPSSTGDAAAVASAVPSSAAGESHEWDLSESPLSSGSQNAAGVQTALVNHMSEQQEGTPPQDSGAFVLGVADVAMESPAYKAGFSRGDLIYAVNGEALKTPEMLQYDLLIAKEGDVWHISYQKQGSDERLLAEVTLEHPPITTPLKRTTVPFEGILKQSVLGNLSPRVNQMMSFPLDTRGVVILEVSEASRKIGFEVHDILRTIDGRSVWTVDDVMSHLAEQQGHMVSFVRAGQNQTHFFAVEK